MKAYLSFLKLRFNVGIQYRVAAIAGIFTQLFFGFLYIFMYEAFYRTGIKVEMEWHQLASYVWLVQAFFVLTYFSLVDTDIIESLVTGQVAYEMVRPINIYWMWYARLLAKKVSSSILRFIPVIVVALLLPAEYALGAPVSFAAFILFLLTLVLGVILSLSIIMVIYGIMFYTISSKGLIYVYGAIADFFAGGFIPIPMMPKILQNICYCLPFRLIIDLPYRLYCGSIQVSEGITSVFIQIFWIGIIMAGGLLLMNHAQRRVVVQGG